MHKTATSIRYTLPILGFITIILGLLSCMMGVANISMGDAAKIIVRQLPFMERLFSFTAPSGDNAEFIVLHIRLPRVCMAILTGAALSVCGAVFQSIFRNPLSDPYTLGVSSGGSLGAAIAIVSGLGNIFFGVSSFAFLGAVLTVWLICRMASFGNRIHTPTLLLSGVAITFFCSATLMLLMILHQEQMDKILFWTMGSFSAVALRDLAWISPIVIIGILYIATYSKELNLLLLGNENARNLGVNVTRTVRLLLLTCTVMVAVLVSQCGVIGFTGLVVPHIIRLLVGSDNRKIIPFSIFGGAIFMILTDTLCRVILSSGELPVGSLTAFIGAPFFIFLLYRTLRPRIVSFH